MKAEKFCFFILVAITFTFGFSFYLVKNTHSMNWYAFLCLFNLMGFYNAKNKKKDKE